MRPKRIPMRMCTGCGEMKPKKELVRVVKSPEGEVSLDLTGKKPGRGAYVCKSAECLRKARKSRRFEKAFSMKIPDEIYDAMEKELTENE
ncbi:RNase P modulator RnpM [Caproicibacterium sp. BJN0003]|uniref:RNase P modulator RnpM n=1 Tax=Caproicibacterium sp. BJN0003 TaxID=2994078 RepID=UPI002257B8F5|nr:YlxR family protein [Caproicibacterium sp. BJN0003]UZT82272.1 YlxR family protein [Caproicibacterium sp. BJN0003]